MRETEQEGKETKENLTTVDLEDVWKENENVLCYVVVAVENNRSSCLFVLCA